MSEPRHEPVLAAEAVGMLAPAFVSGTPADCVAQVERAVEAGARQFLITGFVPDPRAFVRRWMREVAGRVTV